VVDEWGRVTVAWTEGFYNAAGLVVARETEAGWSLSSPTVGELGLHRAARLAVHEDARVLAWERELGKQTIEVRVGRDDERWTLPPGGGTFSFASMSYQPEVLASHDGELVVVWNQLTDADAHFGVCVATRSPGELEFERPTSVQDVLSPHVFFANNPEMARNDRGDMVITWYQSLGGKLRVLVSERFGIDGRFTLADEDAPLSPPEGDVENPEPAVSEDGRAAVLWRQVRPDQEMTASLAERTSDGVWTPQVDIDQAFSHPADFVFNTRIHYTRSGDLYGVWEQRNGDDWAVMAVHRNANGEWLASGREPMRLSRGNQAIDPVLRVGRDGTVVAIWRERVLGEWRIVGRRTAVDALGTSEQERWDSPNELSLAGHDAAAPRLAIGQAGRFGGDRVVAAWLQNGQVFLATID
jgi:hypothetical protein